MNALHTTKSHPRVEYRVTPFGEKFIRVLDELETLQEEIEEEASPSEDSMPRVVS